MSRSRISSKPRYFWRVGGLVVFLLALIAGGTEIRASENVGPVAGACSTSGMGSTSAPNTCSGASVRVVGIPGQCDELTEEEKASQSCAEVTFDEAIANANAQCPEGCQCEDLDPTGPEVSCFQSSDTCFCTCSKSVAGKCASTAVSAGLTAVPPFLIPEVPPMCALAQAKPAFEEQVFGEQVL